MLVLKTHFFRYGQVKKCYIYRFVTDNCLEKRIYDRQINKQGMADRVVDELNPDSVLSSKEVTKLLDINDDDPEEMDFSDTYEKYNDLVMKKVIQYHGKLFTKVRAIFYSAKFQLQPKFKKCIFTFEKFSMEGWDPAYV